jgi:hypothetical protein
MSYEQLGASKTTKDENGVVAVGVYYFEERDRNMKSVWDS